MSADITSSIKGLKPMIGNTPLLEIVYSYKGKSRTIYAKAENLNMTGSIKDRMAYHILSRAYDQKLLGKSTHIIEATSGNTGISFSGLGRALGHPVTIFMPDWLSKERINLMKSFGAEVRLVSKEEGGFLGSIEMSQALAKEIGDAFLPCQFSNNNNVEAHYETTGPELWYQMKYNNIIPHAFVAGVGTGGTIMGVGKFLKEKVAGITIHPLEPGNSPTLSTGYKVGSHRIQGISDEFIPAIVKLNELDEIICVDDGDSIIMSQMLASRGIGVGISSGANFLGAVKIQNKTGDDKIVATVFSDDNKKYLSTDLTKKETVKNDFLTNHIEIISIKAIRRDCVTCCTPNSCAITNYKGEGNREDYICPSKN